MLTIASVLRSGGWCAPADVLRLRDGAARHLVAPHNFVCLTDIEIPGVACLHLTGMAPGWWSKMWLLAPGLLHGRVLYFDLDTVIVGDLSDLASYGGAFGLIGDFYRPQFAQTGIMAWDADGEWPAKLWQAYNPAVHAGTESQAALVRGVVGSHADRLDRLYPGAIVSYKVHVRPQRRVPDGARVVCLHGKPRPSEVANDPCWKMVAA